MRANVRRYTEAYIEAAEATSEAELPALTRRFVEVVARRRQRKLLPKILAAIGQVWNTKHHITSINVTAARAISPEVLKKAFGSKAEVTQTEDPTIIGGAIIDRDDTRIDGSVRASLNRLHTALSRKDS